MYKVNLTDASRLQEQMFQYPAAAESAINSVLHDEIGGLTEDEIKRLMPVSGRTWPGKKKSAKYANSLRLVPGNLSLIVTTQKNYQYLYFPNDGTNTRRHAGQRYFFEEAGENLLPGIIERCEQRLVETFESEV